MERKVSEEGVEVSHSFSPCSDPTRSRLVEIFTHWKTDIGFHRQKESLNHRSCFIDLIIGLQKWIPVKTQQVCVLIECLKWESDKKQNKKKTNGLVIVYGFWHFKGALTNDKYRKLQLEIIFSHIVAPLLLWRPYLLHNCFLCHCNVVIKTLLYLRHTSVFISRENRSITDQASLICLLDCRRGFLSKITRFVF